MGLWYTCTCLGRRAEDKGHRKKSEDETEDLREVKIYLKP